MKEGKGFYAAYCSLDYIAHEIQTWSREKILFSTNSSKGTLS